ncbi:MAG: hypothetical protein AAGN82_00345 [Myxococcota bacterium]
MRALFLGCAGLVAVAAYGCSSDGTADDDGAGGGVSGSGANGADGGGLPSNTVGLFATSGSGGSGGDDSCAQVSQEADLVNRPVDIVFVIDNSGSMGDEIEEVEAQINQNFTSILNSAVPPIDYRVILVAEFGSSAGQQSVCISQPLGGIPDNDMNGRCDSIPGQPVETPNFFHYSVRVESHDALCILLDQYEAPFAYNPPWGAIGPDQFNVHPNGWSTLLRPDAFKFITAISDDGVLCNMNGSFGGGFDYDDQNNAAGGTAVAAAWDAALLALDPAQFGTVDDRNYTFWSIISEQEFMADGMNPYGVPIPATTAINTAECTQNGSAGQPVDPGTGYQGLSILTNGYRYPSCALEYSSIFQLMAQGVIDGAQVACEFEIPDPPDGEELDLDSVEVVYSSSGSEVATYTKVDSEAACTPSSFFIQDGLIELCPGACAVVQADEDAKIDLRFDCLSIVD